MAPCCGCGHAPPSPAAIGAATTDTERLAMIKAYIESAEVPEEVKRKVAELARD